MLIIRNSLLEAFEAVARLGSAHAAAREIGLTQTAITQRIKALESGLSTTAFLRSRRGMSLTDEGKALLRYARGCRELEGQFLSAIQGGARMETAVRVVGPTSAISARVADDVARLYKAFPFMRLCLRADDHADRIEMIRRGEADLAIVSPIAVPHEMDSKMLRPDRYLLVVSADWKGRKIAEIVERERAIDFEESDSTTAAYLSRFGWAARRERLFVNDNEALIRLIAAGIGFGTLTESVAAPHLASGRLVALNRGQAFEDPLALAWYPRPKKMDYFEATIKAIR